MASTYLALPQFQRTAEAVAELQRRQAVRLWIARGGDVAIRFAPLVPRVARSLKEIGISADEIESALDDLEDVLTAVVLKVPAEVFARTRSAPRSSLPEAEPEAEADAARKYELVEELFDGDCLRRTRWLKRTSKMDFFQDLDWEINEKVADDFYQSPTSRPVRFVTFRLVGETHPGDGWSSFAVTATPEDVSYLQALLADLEDRLRDLEVEEAI